MARLARIRSSRKQPLSKRRKHELIVLSENDMMTVSQFKDWKRGEDTSQASFMEEAHLFRCGCGQNKKATIIESVDLGWIVFTKGQAITKAMCPKCSANPRQKLEKDISTFKKSRSN